MSSTSKPFIGERNIKRLSLFGRISVDEDNSLLLLRTNKAFFLIQQYVEEPKYGALYMGHKNDKFYDDFCEFCSRIIIDFRVGNIHETE